MPPVSSYWLGILLVCAGCERAGTGDQSDRGVAWSGTTIDSQGVALITNPAAPLISDSSVSLLVSEREFAHHPDSRDSAAGNLPNPHRIVSGHGKVVILDQTRHVLDYFDLQTGRWLKQVGRKGEGPGEFVQPSRLFVSAQGFDVWDVGKASMESFDSLGTYLSTRRLPGMIGNAFPTLNGDIWVWDFEGSATIAAAEGTTQRTGVDTGSQHAMELPMADASIGRCFYVGGTQTEALIGRCTVPGFYRFSPLGDVQAIVTVDRPARVRGQEELSLMEQRFKSQMVASGIPDSLANTTAARIVGNFTLERPFSNATGIRASGITVVLEQREPELEPTSASLHVFSARGVYMAEIIVPFRVIDISGGEDVLLMLTEDPVSGVRRAAEYRIVLPQEVLAAAER